MSEDMEWAIRARAEVLPPPMELNLDRPSSARTYDFMLGGKDNFAVDREVVQRMSAVVPGIKIMAKHNRAFLQRAVEFMAEEHGIEQFLDLGCGLPTTRNTHDIAQGINLGARVAYVDNDPLVLATANMHLVSDERTRVVIRDVRKPAEVLAHPDIQEILDFDKPVGVVMCGLLHHINDGDDPYGIVQAFRDAVPSKSYFAITNFTRLNDAPETAEIEQTFMRYLGSGRSRTPMEIARFFDGLDLVLPGIVPAPLWRPESPVDDATPVLTRFLSGAVARKA